MAFSEFILPLVLFIIPQYCYDEFFVAFNLFHVSCLKIALSKCLGYTIVALAPMIRLPQILKVLRASSVEGLSLLSFLAELLMQTSTASYSLANGFPFSAWGESLFKAIQTTVLVVLYFYFKKRPVAALLFPFPYAAFVYLLVCGITPKSVLFQLVSLNLPFLVISRVSQILTNFRNGHTGQLSFIMMLFFLFSHAARIFTTLQETGDMMVALVFVVATVLNTTLVLQILHYWNVPISTRKKTA